MEFSRNVKSPGLYVAGVFLCALILLALFQHNHDVNYIFFSNIFPLQIPIIFICSLYVGFWCHIKKSTIKGRLLYYSAA